MGENAALSMLAISSPNAISSLISTGAQTPPVLPMMGPRGDITWNSETWKRDERQYTKRPSQHQQQGVGHPLLTSRPLRSTIAMRVEISRKPSPAETNHLLPAFARRLKASRSCVTSDPKNSGSPIVGSHTSTGMPFAFALHNALDARGTEVVRPALHRQTVHVNRRDTQICGICGRFNCQLVPSHVREAEWDNKWCCHNSRKAARRTLSLSCAVPYNVAPGQQPA